MKVIDLTYILKLSTDLRRRELISITHSKEKKYLKEYILSNTSFLTNKTLLERVFCICNNITSIQLCSVCNKNICSFDRMELKYRKTCSNSRCVSEETKNKISKTNKEIFKKDNLRKEKTAATNLKKYNCKNPMQNIIIKNKQQTSLLKNYGVKYPLKSEFIKEKYKKTCLSNFGTDNPTKNEQIKNKVKETINKRYSIHPLNTIESKLKALNSINKKGIIASKSSQNFCNDLYNLLNDDIKSDCYYSSKKGGEYYLPIINGTRYYYDFTIPSKKIIIEYNGDYYHANPYFYKNDDIILTQKAEDIWKKDFIKSKVALENNYSIFYVWESYYFKNKDEILYKLAKRINKI